MSKIVKKQQTIIFCSNINPSIQLRAQYQHQSILFNTVLHNCMVLYYWQLSLQPLKYYFPLIALSKCLLDAEYQSMTSWDLTYLYMSISLYGTIYLICDRLASSYFHFDRLWYKQPLKSLIIHSVNSRNNLI